MGRPMAEKKTDLQELQMQVLRLKLRVAELEKIVQRMQHEMEGQQAEIENPYHPILDNGDGTVTDTTSGLMWTQSQHLVHDASAPRFEWPDPVGNAARFDSGGYEDWRLPTLQELRRLYNALGMMRAYRSTDTRDRTLLPFDWLGGLTQSYNAAEHGGSRRYHIAFDFRDGSTRLMHDAHRVNYFVRAVRNPASKSPK